MSEIRADNSFEGGFQRQDRAVPFRSQAAGHLAEGLHFAAAPSFAVMALLAGFPGDGGPAEVLCLSAGHTAPFSGMVAMYLLMSVFHLPPWLRLGAASFTPARKYCVRARPFPASTPPSSSSRT